MPRTNPHRIRKELYCRSCSVLFTPLLTCREVVITLSRLNRDNQMANTNFKPSSLAVELSGPAITDTYPFGDVVSILAHLNRIIYATHSELAGELIGEVRLEVRAAFPRRGSLIQPLEILVEVAKTAAVPGAIAASQLTPGQIVQAVQDVFELFRYVWSALRAKHSVDISIPNNQGVVFVNAEGAPPLPVTINVINAAAKAEGEIDALVGSLIPNKIDSMSFSQAGAQKVVLTHEDRPPDVPGARRVRYPLKHLARRARKTPGHQQKLQQDLRATGEIVAFDKERRRGRIKVSGTTDLPAGEYAFKLSGQQKLQFASLDSPQVSISFKVRRNKRGVARLDVSSIKFVLPGTTKA